MNSESQRQYSETEIKEIKKKLSIYLKNKGKDKKEIDKRLSI